MPKDERVYLSMGVLAVASVLTVVMIVALTIVGELLPSVKEFLTALTGHHWITKGLAALAVFALTLGIGALFPQREEAEPAAWSWLISSVALTGTVVLFLFFIGHFAAAR